MKSFLAENVSTIYVPFCIQTEKSLVALALPVTSCTSPIHQRLTHTNTMELGAARCAPSTLTRNDHITPIPTIVLPHHMRLAVGGGGWCAVSGVRIGVRRSPKNLTKLTRQSGRARGLCMRLRGGELDRYIYICIYDDARSLYTHMFARRSL